MSEKTPENKYAFFQHRECEYFPCHKTNDPDNFNCYTYSYVDSEALMKHCFGELEELLQFLLPEFRELCADGVRKNALISKQKEKLTEYFGDPILESGEMLGGRGDKLIAMMLFNFFQYQIESAVVGNQSLFFQGRDEKALKGLRRAKFRSAYDENILSFLEKGGRSPEQSETVKNASPKNGASRHGADAKGSFKFFLRSLLFSIPVIAAAVLLFLLLVFISSRDAFFVSGIKENLFFLPMISLLGGFTLSLNVLARKKEKIKEKTDVQKAPLSQSVKTVLKYFTIFVETLTLVLILTCANSTTAFFENGVSYSTDDFPLSKSFCEYSSIDYIGILNGYYHNDEFVEDECFFIVTKSGERIDLYNSSFFSVPDFEEKAVPVLQEMGIKVVGYNYPES